MKYTPRYPKKNVNVTPTSPLKELAVLLLGVLGIIVGVYLVMGVAVDLVAPHITPNIEHRLAGYLMTNLKKEAAKDTSKKKASVQQLLDRMQNECIRLPYEFKIIIQRNEVVNAAALPGGYIILFTGLLDKMTSENELAFVLAHEMGHFANRDHLKGLGRSLIFMTITAILFGNNSRVGDLATVGLNLTELSFSRDQETRADEYALTALNCYYGHISGATDFFSKITVDEKTEGIGHYLSTHPETKRRVSHIDEFGKENEFVATGTLQKLAPALKASQKETNLKRSD